MYITVLFIEILFSSNIELRMILIIKLEIPFGELLFV